MIYLDSAATSFLKPPQVEQAVCRAFHRIGNAGRGAHDPTLQASRTVYRTREKLAELFHAEQPACIAFSSNATQALNTAVEGLIQPGDHVITTVCEHNSVLRPLVRKERGGVSLSVVAADENGVINPASLAEQIRENTRAVVIQHASNVTGNVNNLTRISEIARRAGALLIVDAAQTAGAIPIDVQAMGIDVLCFTGHKGLLGPQGTGGIYIRKGLQMRPFLVGGSGVHSYDRHHPLQMPTALEAGTLNVHGIAGLNGALQYLQQVGVEQIRDIEQARVRQFVEGASVIRGITLYGDPDLSRRCGIVSLNIGDEDSGWVCDALGEEGEIAVRGGAHCAPRMHEALGTKEQGCVRFSVSGQTTKEEIDETLRVLERIAKECQ